MQDDLLYFNGLNGANGTYDIPPMPADQLAQFILGGGPPENIRELRYQQRLRSEQHLGVVEGVDRTKLNETGWGVIFAHNADPNIKEALSELLDLRAEQAGELYQVYEGVDGYRPGETKPNFCARHRAGPGPVDPHKIPYYLLLVGSPDQIPYQFQHQLDVQYAVGRIHFDTLQEYENYAHSVVASEAGKAKRSRQVSFFSPTNPQDRITKLSSEQLVRPLYQQVCERQPEWQSHLYLGEQATKSQLRRLLGGDQTPALLFAATHGMAFPKGHPLQPAHQGALVCQDWPGPEEWKLPIPQDHYFAGSDLAEDENLLGLVFFCFACYGAGTPLYDEFSKAAFKERTTIAHQPFVADLPTKLLGHAQGGALAFIGHVERAWSYSFHWGRAGAQTAVFESTIEGLLRGYPVGAAVDYFNERYAELASDLSVELENISYGAKVDPYDLAYAWTASNDARGYAIIGDPAVRIRVAEPGATPIERPALRTEPLETNERAIHRDLPADDSPTDSSLDSFPDPSSASLAATRVDGAVSSQVNQTDVARDADLLSLSVSTYTATQSDGTDRRLVARTEVHLDGDVDTTIMASSENTPEPYLALHAQLVKEALSARLARLTLLRQVSPASNEDSHRA